MKISSNSQIVSKMAQSLQSLLTQGMVKPSSKHKKCTKLSAEGPDYAICTDETFEICDALGTASCYFNNNGQNFKPDGTLLEDAPKPTDLVINSDNRWVCNLGFCFKAFIGVLGRGIKETSKLVDKVEHMLKKHNMEVKEMSSSEVIQLKKLLNFFKNDINIRHRYFDDACDVLFEDYETSIDDHSQNSLDQKSDQNGEDKEEGEENPQVVANKDELATSNDKTVENKPTESSHEPRHISFANEILSKRDKPDQINENSLALVENTLELDGEIIKCVQQSNEGVRWYQGPNYTIMILKNK